MIKRSLKMTALLFAAALMMSGCGSDKTTNDQSLTEDSSTSSVVSDHSDVSLIEQSGISYPPVALTKEAAQRILLEGSWVYPNNFVNGYDIEEVIPDADKEAWYYGSSFWFNADGTGYVTIGGFDSTIKYTVNDDCTITITRSNNPEIVEQYAIGTHDKYSTVLYSKNDENILFYLAII